MITYTNKHISKIIFGSNRIKYVYLGTKLIWSRTAIDSNGFLKYFYGNFDLKFLKLEVPKDNITSVPDFFYRPEYIPDPTDTHTVNTKFYYDQCTIFRGDSLLKEFNIKTITGIFDQKLSPLTYLKINDVQITVDENASINSFLKPYFVEDIEIKTDVKFYYDQCTIFRGDSLLKEFTIENITGVFDQKLAPLTYLKINDVQITVDENAILDFFLKPYFAEDIEIKTDIKFYYDQCITFRGDSLLNEFIIESITGVFDQNLPLLTYLKVNDVQITVDENAILDFFFKAYFEPIETIDPPYTNHFSKIKEITGDDIWKEFWFDESEIFDQKFILDNTNISTFF